jgi:hypothetical protein
MCTARIALETSHNSPHANARVDACQLQQLKRKRRRLTVAAFRTRIVRSFDRTIQAMFDVS